MPFVRFINSYSCASYEARPSRRMRQLCSKTFLLTRLLRGATGPRQSGKTTMLISTHAPLTRRDSHSLNRRQKNNRFLLTRLSRGATWLKPAFIRRKKFLLTRLLRGATKPVGYKVWPFGDFYSRASREARRGIFGRMVNPWLISTHAPLARRDSRQQHKE